jgi:hypothetical protein
VRRAASVSMKLCVEPESRRAVSATVLMTTVAFIVRLERGLIPVRAWIEIVGSEVSPAPEQLLAHHLVAIRKRTRRSGSNDRPCDALLSQSP